MLASATLQGPDSELQDKSKQYERKSAKTLEEESTNDESSAAARQSTDDDAVNKREETFVKIIADELNFPTSGIKIIKAPDLSKDSDSKKISETLATMLESQEKWIQKFEEELEEIGRNELEEPERVKTEEEIEGN